MRTSFSTSLIVLFSIKSKYGNCVIFTASSLFFHASWYSWLACTSSDKKLEGTDLKPCSVSSSDCSTSLSFFDFDLLDFLDSFDDTAVDLLIVLSVPYIYGITFYFNLVTSELLLI